VQHYKNETKEAFEDFAAKAVSAGSGADVDALISAADRLRNAAAEFDVRDASISEILRCRDAEVGALVFDLK
jgi:hypothetical protein